MKIKEEIKEASNGVTIVLSKIRYKFISLIFGLFLFIILYYFLVAKVAYNSIWISVMMSGPLFVTINIVAILITSALSGILFSMLLFKFSLHLQSMGSGFFGFIGSGVGAFGVGCPTCGAVLFGLIGMPLALMSLPFNGLELQVLGILILLISIYFMGKSINGVCKLGVNN